MASTLLLKLIANDDAPFPEEFQENNRKILMMHFTLLKQGTVNTQSLTFVSCALSYLSAFMKAGLIDADISTEYNSAAEAIVQTSLSKPYKLSEESANKVKVALEYWLEVVSIASSSLVREIQHKVTIGAAKKSKRRKPVIREKIKLTLRTSK